MNLLLLPFLITLPFVVGVYQIGDFFREGKCSYFYIFSSAFIGRYFWKTVHPIYGIFTSWAVLSVFFQFMNYNQLSDLICIIFAGFMASEWIKLPDRFKDWALEGLCAAAVLSSIYGLLQMLNIDPWFREARDLYGVLVPIALLGHPTFISSFVAPASAWALFKKRYGYFFAANAVLFYCDSTMGWLSLIAVVTVWVGHRCGRSCILYASALLIILLIACGYLLPTAHLFSSSGRIYVWDEASRLIKEGPLLGYGLGSFKNMFMFMVVPDGPAFDKVHNDYLQLVFEMGWGALALVLVALQRALINLWKGIAEPRTALYGAIFLALAVNCVGNFSMRLLPNSLMALFACLELLRWKHVRSI